MGIGYVIGCLLSILFWRIDRQYVFHEIDIVFMKIFKNKWLIQVVYILLCGVIFYFLHKFKGKELYNLLTMFLIIDISNTERKNMAKKERIQFYDSISLISKAIVAGFIAPILYVIILGNIYAMIYMIIYHIAEEKEYKIFNFIFDITSIIPSLIVEILLYLIYVRKNKTLKIDFKGDYVKNSILNPLLNVDIMAAYIESVNFYYYYKVKDSQYIKSYGGYKNRIDESSIKDYLTIAYSLCFISFAIFFVSIRILI